MSSSEPPPRTPTEPHATRFIPPPYDPQSTDPRADQTRRAIVGSFNALVLGHRYDEISVGQIVGSAGVGRSTFYEHFRDKEDLFREAATGILGILAQAANPHCDPLPIQRVLDHVLQFRDACIAMMDGGSESPVGRQLASIILDGLQRTGVRGRAGVPLSLVAGQAAASLLALMRAWLTSGAPCASSSLAMVICDSTRAVIVAGIEPE